jgi:hypothetical protein
MGFSLQCCPQTRERIYTYRDCDHCGGVATLCKMAPSCEVAGGLSGNKESFCGPMIKI